MKYSTVILATVGLVSAQSPADFFPECSIQCLEDAAAAVTDCADGDYKCRCTEENQNALRLEATPCVISACGAEVALQEVLPASEEFCAAVNAGPGPSSSEEPTPTATASEEPTNTMTDTMTNTMSDTTMVTSTGTAEPTATGTDDPTTPAPTSPSGTATPPPVTAGAATLGSVGGVAALFLGALAVF